MPWPVWARSGMDEVTKGVVPFMIAQFAIMFLMVLVPATRDGAGPLVLLMRFQACV